MNLGETQIEAGPLKFALQYRKEIMTDQGVCIQVIGQVNGEDEEILRFDCFDQTPHYHYGTQKKNERINLDKTTTGNPIGWTMDQLRSRLPEMVRRAGYDEIADQLDNFKLASLVGKKLDEVEDTAREMASGQRRTVTHKRGDEVFNVGNVRFGLEFRELQAANDRGLAIHVLSDVAGQEIELLAFDCFERAPHYHYGPRNKDIRIYWDTTLVPDTLEWTLNQFASGNLPNLIERAGYPGIVAELDKDLIISKVKDEIAPRALEIRAANAK
jgi:hypothetical protein